MKSKKKPVHQTKVSAKAQKKFRESWQKMMADRVLYHTGRRVGINSK